MSSLLPPPPPSSSTILYKGTNIDPITVDPPLPLTDEVYSLLQRNKLLSPFLVNQHRQIKDKNLTESSFSDMFVCTCVHNIKPILQRGRPMCGLVALSMASAIIHSETIPTIKDKIEPNEINGSIPLLGKKHGGEYSIGISHSVSSSFLHELNQGDTILNDPLPFKECTTDFPDHTKSIGGHTNDSLSLVKNYKNPTVQMSSSDPLALLEYSKAMGYTNHGEILSSQHLLSIAKECLYCKGKVVHCKEVTPLAVVDWLLEGSVLLVPYDCDKDHTPYLASGHSAHWCLIVGVALPLTKLENVKQNVCDNYWHLFSPNDPQTKELFQSDEVRREIQEQPDLFHVFYRHGKSKYVCLWNLKSLLMSCDNLYELGPQRNPQDYVLPPEGNLKECLCSKLVLLQKAS